MSDKSELYQELKAHDYPFDKPYVNYTVDELRGLVTQVRLADATDQMGDDPIPDLDLPDVDTPPVDVGDTTPTASAQSPVTTPAPAPSVSREQFENDLPGQRLNSAAPDEVLFVDEQGLAWIQKEVRKPAYPKPRGRRVLKYTETGTKTETVKAGDYTETFEVAGDMPVRAAEVKITLPSYQVGIYRDPRFPFKVHVYNDNRGFDLHEVEQFYGGPEMVPASVKRIYVENVLCYDMRTVVRAIQDEHRALQLTGRVQVKK